MRPLSGVSVTGIYPKGLVAVLRAGGARSTPLRSDRTLTSSPDLETAATKKPAWRRAFLDAGVPKGIRTPVTAVKGRCPRPLDDGDLKLLSDSIFWWS